MKLIIRRWLPTVIAVLLIVGVITAWTVVWCLITKYNTTLKLREEYEMELQAYINSLNYIPEDTKKMNEIDELANYIDELIAGYSMNSNINTEGCYAIGWCFISRFMTKGFFGSTPEEILNAPNQWQWYKADNPVREQDRVIARAIATAYIERNFPNDFTTDLNYAELKTDGSVVLRNELIISSNTKLWRYRG